MKRSLAIFLQVIVVLIGIGALALLLWEPQIEGRNVDATNFEIYFKDSFLAYAYTASVAFFVALYQAFKFLGYMRRREDISEASVKALRIIKHCAMILIFFIVGAEAYLLLVARGKDPDIAGGVMLGLILIVVSVAIATAAAVFENKLRNAVKMKSENDVTV